jgi:hypothetical protein
MTFWLDFPFTITRRVTPKAMVAASGRRWFFAPAKPMYLHPCRQKKGAIGTLQDIRRGKTLSLQYI